jgi:hypothetical protein
MRLRTARSAARGRHALWEMAAPPAAGSVIQTGTVRPVPSGAVTASAPPRLPDRTCSSAPLSGWKG